MINAIVEGFTSFAKKPLLFLPALFVMGLNFIVLLAAFESYFNLFFETLVLGEVPDAGLLELPFFMLTTYGADIIVIGLAAFVSFALGFYMIYIYASLLAGKETGMIKAIIANAKRTGEILGLTLFVSIALFLYGIVAYLLFVASVSIEALGLIAFILLLIWGLFGLFVYFKFAFTPVLMATEKQKLKPALAAVWKWSSPKLISIIIFLIIIGFLAGIINTVFITLADATGSNELGILLLLLGFGLSNAYYNISFVKYFTASKNAAD